jgi:thymidine kinase
MKVITMTCACRKEVSMAEANRMAQMSIRKHMGHDVPEPDESLLIGPSDEYVTYARDGGDG